jgi:6-phosphofructokinase 1
MPTAAETTALADVMVASLGEPRYDSPLADYVADRQTNEHYVDEDDRVIYHDTVSQLAGRACGPGDLPSFEPGGPRRKLYFQPGRTASESSPAAACAPASTM